MRRTGGVPANADGHQSPHSHGARPVHGQAGPTDQPGSSRACPSLSATLRLPFIPSCSPAPRASLASPTHSLDYLDPGAPRIFWPPSDSSPFLARPVADCQLQTLRHVGSRLHLRRQLRLPQLRQRLCESARGPRRPADRQAHIADPNERRRLALAEIDKAPFGWYHVRACMVAGIGFFTDAYDLFAINFVTTMLGVVYFQNHKTKPGTIPTNSDTAIKISTSAGMFSARV